MEHGKRLEGNKVDVQNADRKQPADERRMQVPVRFEYYPELRTE